MRSKAFTSGMLAAVLLVSLSSTAAKSTFGTGTNEPLPNLVDIEIYNVTGLSETEQRTGGTLIASGLNTTFQNQPVFGVGVPVQLRHQE
ncbi:MAG: hypothetical protein ABEJ98_02270 [Candidatus Nanohaloarchaea archaeon]